MAIKVKQVGLWTGKLEDMPGGAARVLEPLAQAKVDLEFVLVRRTPEEPGKGVIFVSPIKGAKAEQAARSAGLSAAAGLGALRIEGDNQPGTGHTLTRAIGNVGVSFRGLSTTVFGKKFVCFMGFDSPSDASRAEEAITASTKKGAKK